MHYPLFSVNQPETVESDLFGRYWFQWYVWDIFRPSSPAWHARGVNVFSVGVEAGGNDEPGPGRSSCWADKGR